MNLESLTIKNFRSITKAYKLPLSSSTTVLIGPNNEGKSNVLRALVLATRVLIGRRRTGSGRYIRRGDRIVREEEFDWDRDFPLHLQEKSPRAESEFVLEYGLSPIEIEAFRAVVGSRLNGTLPIKVAIGKSSVPKVTVLKQGRSKQILAAKADKVAAFVAERVDLDYIPAVRTADSAQEVVDALVARELATLEDTREYKQALEAIDAIQRPVLIELSKAIRSTLQQFLPAVVGVDVRVPLQRRFEALRRCEIFVDDGSMTELRYKGDGVQSLAALGLMRHVSSKSSLGKNVVVAIEEPESHLHPKAIHELRSVLEQLGARHQIVITTHCPLFVSRREVASNILVNARTARAATSIDEIRDVLGVRAADNLLHAELVLVVEGEDDRVSASALLSHCSPTLAEALKKNRLAVDTLGGASNLAYKLGLLRDALCAYHVLLDDDASGNRSYVTARNARLLTDGDINMTKCRGMKEAEFEDLLAEDLIDSVLLKEYRIAGAHTPKASRSQKWSERMKSVFESAGKPWSDHTCSALKSAVAREVAARPGVALHAHRREVFDALVRTLEARLHVSQM